MGTVPHPVQNCRIPFPPVRIKKDLTTTMAHNFVEHIAGKVVQRIVLTNAPMLTRLTFSFRTGLDFPLSWTSEWMSNSFSCGTGKMAMAG